MTTIKVLAVFNPDNDFVEAFNLSCETMANELVNKLNNTFYENKISKKSKIIKANLTY